MIMSENTLLFLILAFIVVVSCVLIYYANDYYKMGRDIRNIDRYNKEKSKGKQFKWFDVSVLPPIRVDVLVEIKTTRGLAYDVSYFWGDNWDIEHMNGVINVTRWAFIPDK